jgi:hypothetical protein
MLSKLTTHGVGTPSSLGVNSSSDTKPRCVLVRAATTTEPMRSATGSRVSTSTGRSPPGVAANQISPRCIAPLSPILSRPPVSNLLKRALRISERHLLPRLDIMLATEAYKVSMKSVAKDLRALHPQSFGPPLDLSSLDLRDTETKHRHTEENTTYDTRRAPVTAPLVALTSGVSRHATRQRRTLRRPQSGIPSRARPRVRVTCRPQLLCAGSRRRRAGNRRMAPRRGPRPPRLARRLRAGRALRSSLIGPSRAAASAALADSCQSVSQWRGPYVAQTP